MIPVTHPTSIEDKDYVVFNVDNDKIICDNYPIRITTNKQLEKGVLLILNKHAVVVSNNIKLLGKEWLMKEDTEYYNTNKRFFEENHHLNYYIEHSKDFNKGEEIKELNITEVHPINDSFTAEKEFHKSYDFGIWFSRHKFTAGQYFIGGGISDGWDETGDVDKGLMGLIDDFNNMDFVYTHHFCCSGLRVDHEEQKGYRDYGFIRFKYDKDSEDYLKFEDEIINLDNVEITPSDEVDGFELRVYSDNDLVLNHSWEQIHEIIKKYI